MKMNWFFIVTTASIVLKVSTGDDYCYDLVKHPDGTTTCCHPTIYNGGSFSYNRPIVSCPDSKCKNRSLCIVIGNARKCICRPGFDGECCSEPRACTACGTDKSAYCTYEDWEVTPICECHNKSESFDNEKKTCRASCSRSDPQRMCKNGGRCGQSDIFCRCLPGTTGNFCSEVTDCKQVQFCGTNGDAGCTYDTRKARAVCLCANVSQEFDYEKKICRAPCSLSDPQRMCKNGGLCGQPFIFCRCLRGTTGYFCSDVTDCEQEHFCGTNNDSACTYDTEQAKAVCLCSNVSKEFDYKEKICRAPCQVGRCENGGFCIKGFCECLPGTVGDFCEQISACQNNSFCSYDDEAQCVYDRIEKKAVCECSTSDSKFICLTENCCKKSNGYLAIFLGAGASLLLLLLSVLFYLHYKKHGNTN